MCFPRSYQERLPYEWTESYQERYLNRLPYQESYLKILGVLFDEHMSYSNHVRVLMGKAGVRHGVVSRLTRSNWGLETNILRVANEALLTSLTRYCLPMIGSGLYENDLRMLEVRHAHIGARRVAGLGMTARIESMLMVAGSQSVHNLFLLTCANKLDRCLRAHGSSILNRLSAWTAETFGLPDWRSVPTYITPVGVAPVRRGVLSGGFYEFDIKEIFICNLLKRDTPSSG